MRKKILFLIDTLNVGGAEKSLLEILPRIKRYRVEICHIYPGEELKNQFELHGIKVYSLQVPLPYNFSMAVTAASGLVEEIKPDIIHSSLFKSDIVSRRVAPRFNIPLVNSLVNNSYHPRRYDKAGFKMTIKLKAVQWLDAITARKVDLFISNSEAIRASNSRALHIPLRKIRVIYRGRNLDDFSEVSSAEKDALRKELQAEGRKIILNVSRLLDRKGQLDLIRAFYHIRKQFRDSILLIAGEGPFRRELELEIARLDLSDHICLLGTRKDVARLLSVADCFAFPSYYEGLPGALIEAMMASVPIAASRIPENEECIDDDSAEWFTPGNIEEMISAITNIFSSADNGRRKGIRAREIALSKFEVNKIASQYEDAYDTLLLHA